MNTKNDSDSTLSDAAEKALSQKPALDAIAEELVAEPAKPKKATQKQRARAPRQSHPDEVTPDGLITEGEALTPKSTKVREGTDSEEPQDEDLEADTDADTTEDDDDTPSDPFDFLDDLTAQEEGDEPTPGRADEDQPVSEDDGEVYKVKVDGKEVEVSLADLKRSYSREGAYDKRMQEVTEARNNAEAAVREELTPYIREVTDFHQRLKHVYENYNEVLFSPRVPPPDPKMREEDPIGFTLHTQDYQADQQRLQQERAQMEQTLQAAQQIEQQQQREYLQQEAAELYRRMPGLKNKEYAAVFKQKIADVGQAHGFTPEEIASAADHRMLTLAAEAAAYRELKASLSGKKQTASAPTKVRPMPTRGNNRPKTEKSRKQSQRKKVLAKARETGAVDDVAASLLF